MGEEARKKLFLPEQGKPWRSLPAFDESSIGNADYLNAYLERVEFLAKVLEYSSQPFSLVTPEGEILDCNPAFLNMVGYTKEELSSISWDKDLTPSEWHDVQNHYLGKLQKTGVPVRYEKEYLTKDGRRIAVELLVHQFTDRESGKRHYYSFITDISQRKKAEESQRELERHLADIIDFLPDATFVIDASGRVMRWNRAVADMTGIRAEEMVGKSNHEYALPFYGFRRPILADLALNTSIQRPEYMYFQRKFLTLVAESYCPAIKGGGAYVWAKASPLFDQNGRLMGAIETLRDMTKHKQSEEALRQSEERYRNILESIEDGYFEVDIRGNLTFSNNSLNESLGYLKQDLFNMNYKQYMDSENARKVFQAFNKVYLTKEPTREVDWHLTRQDGSKLFAEASVSAILNSQGKVSGFRGIVRDVTQRKEAEEALRQSESKYRLVFENTPLGILHFDGQGRITACNESLIQIVGPSEKGTLIGFNLLHLPEKGLAEGVKQALNGQKAYFQGDFRSNISDKVTPIEAQIAPVMSEEGQPLGGVIIVSDFTERKQYEDTIRHLAYHDALTGLPNRLLIQDRITVALSQSKRYKQLLALVYIDLDNFKVVNDTLGHMAGDELLQHVSRRLKSLVREGDTIARMGGDEFMLLFPDIKEPGDAVIIASKILQSFSSPYHVDGHEIHTTASIGISVFPEDGQDVETLIKNADSALYRAKEQGGNNYQVFTSEMNEFFLERLTLTKDLRHALEREELVLHYQPLINTKSGRIVGMEALVRWQHPRNGLILPGRFIHVAEETGLIIPLEKWVLRTACRQNKWWQDAGLATVRVAVNISGRHFWQQDLVKTVAGVLEETGLDPKYLELEITESIAIRSEERVSKVLQELRNLGIKVALDDFGTGYSSLSYLRKLPLDSLKIDQSFIRELGQEEEGLAIPLAVISLARTLDLTVTAEGVEKPEQVAVLSSLDCDQIQGYLICRPQPAHCITHLLAQTRGTINHDSQDSHLP
ncbi:MAG: PAS domain S-box protein [Syntrophomonadales bacterium]